MIAKPVDINLVGILSFIPDISCNVNSNRGIETSTSV